MKLVIAEKASVGRAIAKLLGAEQKQDGYMEGGDYIVSWCVGHLLEPAKPEAYGIPKIWRRDVLPIIPSVWQYTVFPKTQTQFEVLKQLMDRSDVDSLICATDAGREGELIFRLVYEQAGCSKPFERLWVSSLEESALRKGFENLRPSSEYDALYAAALCRQKADWVVGINATRLLSCVYAPHLLNIGRVMTPTLALLVERESAIEAFTPTPFYTVQATTTEGFIFTSRQFQNKADAKRICDGCSTLRVVSVETKERSEQPPKLYDTATLLRESNRLFGFPAQQTQNHLQTLYECQMLTYPRTDSQFITSSMDVSAMEIAAKLPFVFPFLPKDTHCDVVRIINDAKVSDHHAIIPTAALHNKSLEQLTASELRILQLASTRFFCAMGTPYRYMETKITAESCGETFTLSGKTLLENGWKDGWNGFLSTIKDSKANGPETVLPEVTQGSTLAVTAELKEGRTKPPEHFTEDTLLGAMATAGVKETSDDAERKGLGSPALRAAIIEKLLKANLMERKKLSPKSKAVYLFPTQKGCALISVLPEQIQSPLLTAEWENRLAEVRSGAYDPEAFMQGITDMVRDLVQHYQRVPGSEALFPDVRPSVGKCPRCGCNVVEIQKGFVCVNHGCKFALWKSNRLFVSQKYALTPVLVSELLSNGRASLHGCTSQKTGKTYDCVVVLDDKGGDYVDFKLEFPKKKKRR